ncbi:hypothetical protein, partial [Anaplasma phagocytophilum]|uniref:hypothetical protein n=1 Tax=Anaplasma phagocytophilum TaxID=948 RepID=UPI000A7650E9
LLAGFGPVVLALSLFKTSETDDLGDEVTVTGEGREPAESHADQERDVGDAKMKDLSRNDFNTTHLQLPTKIIPYSRP